METQSVPYIVVLVTSASEQEGETIAHALLEAKLAACINLNPVNSIYTWQNKINRDREWQLTIKTKFDLFDELAAKIKALHSYEVPEIIAIPIVTGSQSYLNWIEDNLKARENPTQKNE